MIDKFIYGFIDRVYGANDYTQQEINAKLIQKMDEVIENCNNAFEFVDWLKEEGIPEEVQNIINAMIEDGTLEKIINSEIMKELKTDINNLNSFKDEVTTKLNEINAEIQNIKNTINSNQPTDNTV